MLLKIPQKWTIAVKILPIILGIIAIKIAIHFLGWELITLSPLFSSIIAASVFLLGFLLAGTLTDYKESEKLPGELSASMETILDECLITYKNKKAKEAKDAITHLSDFSSLLLAWIHKKEKTNVIMEKIEGFNDYFLSFEKLTQPNFIVRLKQEQHAIRKMIIRIHTIRETSFVQVGYAIAELIIGLLTIGFLFTKIDPFWDSLFFVVTSIFLMIYMLFLIKDLDNPFDYYLNGKEAAAVSLEPLEETETKIKNKLKQLK